MKTRKQIINHMLESYTTHSANAVTVDLDYSGLKLLMLTDEDCYDFYLKDEHHPYCFMFGLPVDRQSDTEAIEIAICSVLDYMNEFTGV